LEVKSALPNENWDLTIKWQLFLFIFPVNFPVNREFCESRELSTLSTAPFSPSFLNKLNDTSGLDHLSEPLLGPLGQILLYFVKAGQAKRVDPPHS